MPLINVITVIVMSMSLIKVIAVIVMSMPLINVITVIVNFITMTSATSLNNTLKSTVSDVACELGGERERRKGEGQQEKE